MRLNFLMNAIQVGLEAEVESGKVKNKYIFMLFVVNIKSHIQTNDVLDGRTSKFSFR